MMTDAVAAVTLLAAAAALAAYGRLPDCAICYRPKAWRTRVPWPTRPTRRFAVCAACSARLDRVAVRCGR